MNVGWSAIAPLVIGLIIGWLIEWVIDWIYWRRQRVSRAEYDALAAQVGTLQKERDNANTLLQRHTAEVNDLQQRLTQAENSGAHCQADLGASKALIAKREAELATLTSSTAKLHAELATANEQRNQRAGEVTSLQATVTQLRSEHAANQQSQLELETLRASFAALQSQHQDLESSYSFLRQDHEQALADRANLLRQHEQGQADLRAAQEVHTQKDLDMGELSERFARAHTLLKADHEQTQANLALALGQVAANKNDMDALQASLANWQHEHAGVSQARALLSADHEQATNDVDGLRTQLGERESTIGALQAMIGQLQGELHGLRTAIPARRDPLIDINGIGPVYEERLFAAGITTFAQVAEQNPDRLREIVAAKEWQDIDPEAWIAEARSFAEQVQNGTYRKGRA
jgi:predicted flap endonuclease-1-like 5' DNA nuclease/predicted nuclease with TOPRIM domain